jgi:hypothetical protein
MLKKNKKLLNAGLQSKVVTLAQSDKNLGQLTTHKKIKKLNISI